MQASARILSLLLAWLCAAQQVSAQTPSYLHYGVQEGLPSNLVYCGVQDHRGLLWFGTDKGLACFDGTRFRTLGVKDGLPDPEVLNLMEDSRGRLWISSYRKKPCYRQNGQFATAQQDSFLSKIELQSPLWEFYEDAERNVWLSGQSDNFLLLGADGMEVKRASGSVVRLGVVDGALFLFGIKFIYQFQKGGDLKVVGQPDAPVSPDVNPFRGLSISGNRALYSFADRLLLLEWRDGQFHEIARRKTPLGRVFTDSKGRFWVCSLAEGAVCFDNDQRDLSNPVYYFPKEKVTAMFDDRQGTHWFCTTDNGIYAIPQNTAVNFSKSDGLASNNLTALAAEQDGCLWAGDDEGNLYEFGRNDAFNIIPFGSTDGYNRIRRILLTPEGARWLVTDERLYYEKGRFRQKIKVNVSPKNAALQPGKFWFASSGGLGYIREGTFDIVRVADGRFTALSGDSDGYMWAGTNEGVFCQSDSFLTDWGVRFPELRGRIVAIEKAGEDSLWVVTPEKGLLLAHVKAGSVRSVQIVNEQLESPIDNIQSLYPASNGQLWLATNRGVCRLGKGWNVARFDRHDGLADDDVNAVLVRGDTLWAATVGGLSRLLLKAPDEFGDFPTLVTKARYRSGDQAQEFFLLDSLPSARRRIVLPPDATLFEIELAALDFRSHGNMRYECVSTQSLPPWQWWTLDNLATWLGNQFNEKSDTSRVSAGNLSFGVHLPPGCYHLKISAITAGGVRSMQPDIWVLEMRPFRYNTVWFWLFLWGLTTYGVWRIVRARNAFRKLDAAVSELQLQALQAQMNPHFVGNSINAIQQFFYPPDPARASEYIALFTRLLRRTLSFSEQTFIPFSEEIAYDRDYLEMMKLRFGDRFQFEISGAENAPPDAFFPSLLLQPLLENATLHGLAPEGVSILRLDFSFSKEKLTCAVTDNGVGFREVRERQKAAGKDYESKGLELLLQKAETLNRRFDLGLELELFDLSDAAPPAHGTRAVVQFFPKKIPFAK